jgi:hypothetical protein
MTKGSHVSDTDSAQARQAYDAAYDLHYGQRNPREALRLYRELLALHPASEEAGYARSQILNITHGVVPAGELLDVQADLAAARLAGG